MWNTKACRIQVKLNLICESISICNNWQLCCLRTPGLPGGIYFGSGATSIPTNLVIGNNDYVLLADKFGTQIMKANADVSGNSVDVETGPDRDYAAGSYLAQYHSYIFYLKDNGDYNSLMLSEGQPVFNNVDDFQIQHYQNGAWQAVGSEATAGYVNGWCKKVKGIRITYQVAGENYTISNATKGNVM